MSPRLRSVLLLFVLCAGIFAEEPGEVFQVSTYDALSLGIFQGSMSFNELRRHGDFGLGTFDALDGEMIAIDGSFFQVRSDGAVVRVENGMTTPFAMVTHFKPNLSIAVRGPATRSQVFAVIDQILPSANYFYALKIQGQFISVTARSVPRQLQRYPTLTDAIAQQSFSRCAISGEHWLVPLRRSKLRRPRSRFRDWRRNRRDRDGPEALHFSAE